LSSTFKQLEPTSFNQLSANDDEGYEYGRCGNPSRSALEKSLAPLEKANYALAFASGMSAISSLIYLLKSDLI
jgi:cystathionine beta-lyase/cystathionine gamma-synthase